jgi:hypothetical protein
VNLCPHIQELRAYLESAGLSVWSEHGESPSGWVNVHCEKCHRTEEITLRKVDGKYEEE